MSGSALPQIQDAVRTALSTDSALAALVTGVFDQVPAGQTFPYVVFGEKSEGAFGTFGRHGLKSTLRLDIRSQAGDAELLAIYDRVKEVLEQQPLALSEYTVILSRTTLLKTVLDPDGTTRRAESQLEVIAQEA